MATKVHAPRPSRQATSARYNRRMKRSNCAVRRESLLRNSRNRIRFAMLPWHQLRAATGILFTAATRSSAEQNTAAPCLPT